MRDACIVCLDAEGHPACTHCVAVLCTHCALRWCARNPTCPLCRRECAPPSAWRLRMHLTWRIMSDMADLLMDARII